MPRIHGGTTRCGQAALETRIGKPKRSQLVYQAPNDEVSFFSS